MPKKPAPLARLYVLRDRSVWAIPAKHETTVRKLIRGMKDVRLYRKNGELRLRRTYGNGWTEWVLGPDSIIATWGNDVWAFSRTVFDEQYELAGGSPTLSVLPHDSEEQA